MASIIKIRNIKRALATGISNESVSYILSGRISDFRIYKSFNFIDLIDGSTKDHIQVIVKRSLLNKPELGAYITCQGTLVPSKGPKQPIEFKVDDIKFLSRCDPYSYPLATSYTHSNDWYRKLSHLRPRIAHFASMLRVKSELELSIHMIMKQMDFFRVHTPSLTSNDSEASSDLFNVRRSKVYNHLHGLFKEKGDEEDDRDVKSEEDNKYSDNHGDRRSLDLLGRKNIDDALPEGLHCLDDKKASDSQLCKLVKNGDEKFERKKEEVREEGEEQEKGKEEWKGLDERRERTIRDGYFNKDVFLITSAQLHLESLAGALSRVYCISSAFRAENSISTRHLCEFLMFELEEANVSELGALMNRAESVVKFIAQFLSEISEYRDDFNSLIERNSNKDTFSKLAETPYIRMSYDEALSVLRDKTDFQGNTKYGCDIGRLHEKKLLDYTDNVPIFLTNYPRQLKPFYMKCDANDKEALCFDLIAAHGGEICGGSLREESSEKLLLNLEEQHRQQDSKKLDSDELTGSLKHFNWYLDSRRFGSFPHGGFGMGIERLLQSLLGIKNIKDTTAFPRWVGHCPM